MTLLRSACFTVRQTPHRFLSRMLSQEKQIHLFQPLLPITFTFTVFGRRNNFQRQKCPTAQNWNHPHGWTQLGTDRQMFLSIERANLLKHSQPLIVTKSHLCWTEDGNTGHMWSRQTTCWVWNAAERDKQQAELKGFTPHRINVNLPTVGERSFVCFTALHPWPFI